MTIPDYDTHRSFAEVEVSRQYRLMSSELKVLAVDHELRLSRYAVYLLLVGMLLALGVAYTVNAQLGLILATICAVITCYYQFAVPRLLVHQHVGGRIRAVNVTLEVSIPALIHLVDIWIMGGAYTVTSTLSLITVVVVVGSGLRLSRRLAIYAGLLAAVEYLGIYALARLSISEELLATLPTLGWLYAVQHAIYLLLAGVLAAVVANVMRQMTERLVDQGMEKERVYDRFGEYVSQNPISLVIDDEAMHQGIRRQVTVLSSDIRDFTRLSYQADPAVVVGYLNDYFGSICGVISRHGGMVDKFTGDGCLAIFGVLDDEASHALQAARAALEIVRTAHRIQRPDGEPTCIGIGLHSGEVVLGSIGAPGRKDYTAIGDTVNLAARVEGLTRELAKEVVLTPDVAAATDGELETRELGSFEIRGRDGRVRLLELIDVRD